MTETTYRIIGYGVANYGFFNQFNFSSTREGAMTDFQRLIGDPEMDGAVVIEVNHEDWRVVAEFTADYTISIAYGPLGTFKVERAPQLVLV